MRGMRSVWALVCVFGLGLVVGCAPTGPPRVGAVIPTSERLPQEANGIAFVRDGGAFVIRDGAAVEVVADGATKLAVGYSADGRNLLVTEERGSRRVVLMVAGSDEGSETVVLDTREGSALGTVRVATNPDVVFYSVFGDPSTSLMKVKLTSTAPPSVVPLDGSFSGEFDVAASGRSIVYTSEGQNPATVVIREGNKERTVVAGLATAFTPAFSRDGTHVSFTGAERTGAELSVWVVKSGSDKPEVVAGTEGLKPTSPVSSPDGTSIAFRGGEDGSIWIVPAAGGAPQRVAVNADEAPIAW